jgi:hypothetical protein
VEISNLKSLESIFDDDDFPQKIGVYRVFADVFATRLQAATDTLRISRNT